MDSDSVTRHDETTTAFLAFARGLLLRVRDWEKESGPPLFEDVEVRFVEEGRRSDIVRKLDYERFLHRRWDSSLAEITELGRDCVRLHLDSGLVKAPRLTDDKGAPVPTPSLEELLPSLVWAVRLQTLDVTDADLIDTYERFVRGWSMADVPQHATVPLLNFVAGKCLKIAPFLEITPFTPADKNLLFARTAVFDGHRQPDYYANFKLAGQFSNETSKPVHFGTIAYETRLAVMAMRLLKEGDVGARMMYYRSSLEHEVFTGGSGLHFDGLIAVQRLKPHESTFGWHD